MTLTLELSEEMERRLREAAAQQQTSPEEVLLKLADKYLEEERQLSSEEFRALAQGVIDDNRELLERLA